MKKEALKNELYERLDEIELLEVENDSLRICLKYLYLLANNQKNKSEDFKLFLEEIKNGGLLDEK